MDYLWIQDSKTFRIYRFMSLSKHGKLSCPISLSIFFFFDSTFFLFCFCDFNQTNFTSFDIAPQVLRFWSFYFSLFCSHYSEWKMTVFLSASLPIPLLHIYHYRTHSQNFLFFSFVLVFKFAFKSTLYLQFPC